MGIGSLSRLANELQGRGRDLTAWAQDEEGAPMIIFEVNTTLYIQVGGWSCTWYMKEKENKELVHFII